jgi:circadian clock protein KaiC
VARGTAQKPKTILKVPTGIVGLDQITGGGLPRGRATLVAGGPGSGKTLLGMEFLLRGIMDYGEPAVAMTFEETGEELTANLSSLGYDLSSLTRDKKLIIDHVQIERREIEETGAYDLEGLFIRLEHAIDSIKAKRVLLDTVEVLFAGLQNAAVVRSELRRLFRWLKDKGVTAVVTSEIGAKTLTRRGLEEYVADCVIVLDHRVNEQISTRRIRVLKYRGSYHGTNEYPFLIDTGGISVLPITAIGLTHEATEDRLSSGVAGLDDMMGGRGFFRASSVLVTGTAGTGKSILAAHFANASCARGERCIYFAFEESPSQILRNMRSVGVDLERWMRRGLLTIQSTRPTSTGLENHLVQMHRVISESMPSSVVVDPITNLISVGDKPAVKSMLTRLIDFLKMQKITALFTNLSTPSVGPEMTMTEISSLMDVWISVRDVEEGQARRRLLYILKSRGMAHSNHVHEFRISHEGVEIYPAEASTAAAGESRGLSNARSRKVG